jgi:hypothetical protein
LFARVSINFFVVIFFSFLFSFFPSSSLHSTEFLFFSPTFSLSFCKRYQIFEEGFAEYFKLIFYDFSFSFLDCCFSPDSQSLISIPSKFPELIFILNLPLITGSKNGRKSGSNLNGSSLPSAIATTTATTTTTPTSKQDSQPQKEKEDLTISFEGRIFGPLSIIGPAKGAFGQPLKMSHISSNNPPAEPENDSYHLVTWNNDGWGEYCLWKIFIVKNNERQFMPQNVFKFEWFPKLIIPGLQDRCWMDWLEDEDNPKNFILDIQFSPKDKQLMLTVKRENYTKKVDNGIGLYMIKIDSQQQPPPLLPDSKPPPPPQQQDVFWYQVTESLDPHSILAVKWSNTLLLGTQLSAAILVKVSLVWLVPFCIFFFCFFFFFFFFCPKHPPLFRPNFATGERTF